MISKITFVTLFLSIFSVVALGDDEKPQQVVSDQTAVEQALVRAYEDLTTTLNQEKNSPNWDNIEKSLYSTELALRQLHDSLSSLASYEKNEKITHVIMGGGAVTAATFGYIWFWKQLRVTGVWESARYTFLTTPAFGKVWYSISAVIVPTAIVAKFFVLKPAREKLEKAVERELEAAKKMYENSCKTLNGLLEERQNSPITLDSFRTLKATCDGLRLAKSGAN